MKRRGNGEGSVHQLADGSWRAAVMISGRRRYLRGKTRAIVQRRLQEARTGGISSSMRLDKFLVLWLAHVKPLVRENTYAGYERIVRLHIIPAIGHTPLRNVTGRACDDALNIARQQGRGENTIGHIRRVLAMAFGTASAWELVTQNPAQRSAPARPSDRAIDPQPLTRDELLAFVTAAEGSPDAAMLLVAAFTGARRGEVLGLKWADVDTERGTLAINRTMQRVKGGVVEMPPKSKSSRRTVRVPEKVLASLKAHRIVQAEQRMKNADVWQDQGFLFTRDDGRCIPPEALNAACTRTLAAAGLTHRRLHDLRHTAATLLVQAGVNIKAVSGFLGHSSVVITLDTYAHSTPESIEGTMVEE